MRDLIFLFEFIISFFIVLITIVGTVVEFIVSGIIELIGNISYYFRERKKKKIEKIIQERSARHLKRFEAELGEITNDKKILIFFEYLTNTSQYLNMSEVYERDLYLLNIYKSMQIIEREVVLNRIQISVSEARNERMIDKLVKENTIDLFGHIEYSDTSHLEELLTKLQQLERLLRKRSVTDKRLSSMDGYEFEHYCADILLESGFSDVNVTSGSGDRGVDITAYKNGALYAFQCKLYNYGVSRSAVQQIYTGMNLYNADYGYIMTNSWLTPGAQLDAKELNIEVWIVS